MTSKSYNLQFKGYWREPNIGGLPAKSGVYSVYACTYNSSAETVSIRKLLYIGESDNVQDRVASHEKWPEWKRHLRPGEQLCFNAALVSGRYDRERAEAAMIFKHKPPCNIEFVDSFPYDTTTVRTSGRNALLHERFTVHPTTAKVA